MITLTVDLEDPTGRYEPDGRYVHLSRRILELCDTANRRATFFIIGRVIESAPQLIKEISAKGHEIAYHSHNHVSLTEEDLTRFRRESKIDKDRFEQLTGKAVMGFRAPRFSLTPESLWVTTELMDLGFRYSSSIMPTSLSRFGFQTASSAPFQWPNGLIEFPLPVASFGPFRIPYLGGIYLYALPFGLTRYWAHQANPTEVLWTYTHPYDFDRDEAFARMPGEPLWVSLILWGARFVAEKKIRSVLTLGPAPTMIERMTEMAKLAPRVEP